MFCKRGRDEWTHFIDSCEVTKEWFVELERTKEEILSRIWNDKLDKVKDRVLQRFSTEKEKIRKVKKRRDGEEWEGFMYKETRKVDSKI